MKSTQKILLVCLTLMLLGFAAGKNSERQLKEVADTKYKPGDVWTYKTRPGEQASRLTILRIDAAPENRRIVHIRLENIRLKNCMGGPEPDKFEHMPFAKGSIDSSVIEKIGGGNVPDFKDGYTEWRNAWDAGRAGIYTISVAEAVQVAEQNFRHGLGCSN